MAERYPPEDPQEWMNRARSNLRLARALGESIYLEDLCFNAQQAAEKASRALLIHLGTEFPYVHDLAQLLTLLDRAGVDIPAAVREAVRLTRFAVLTRHPGVAGPVSQQEYEEAVRTAEEAVTWVEGCLRASPPADPEEPGSC